MGITWDYLILTASNDRQAGGYESQLALRQQAGLLADVGTVLVVADPHGKRVGSGGSTLYCLMRVVAHCTRHAPRDVAHCTHHAPRDAPIVSNDDHPIEAPKDGCRQPHHAKRDEYNEYNAILRNLRILILHAGGDSRRVPAYGPCGKIFSPVPGETAGPVISTLFDHLYPLFQDLPRGPAGAGQVVVAAGDALMIFDAAAMRLDRPGIVALGVPATPEAASKHGVFCAHPDGGVRWFLQKPSRADQQRYGAINSAGQTLLDIGVMSFDAAAAVAMFRAFDVLPGADGPTFSPAMEHTVLDRGLDLYREICCGLGSEATAEHHRVSSAASGSTWPAELLANAHAVLSQVPFRVEVLPECAFLHFGTTRQLITSGVELCERLSCISPRPPTCLSLNNRITASGRIDGSESWVEGCRLAAPLCLAGQNVVVGVDVDKPLSLPRGACLDVIAGHCIHHAERDEYKVPVWFVRCYGIGDTFKDPRDRGGTLAGIPLAEWLAAAGAKPENVWDAAIPPAQRSLWDAKVFPAVDSPTGYRDWLWMFDPAQATAAEKRAFLAADRYSAAQIALLADMKAFYERRMT